MEDWFWMTFLKLAIVAMAAFCLYMWWQFGLVFVALEAGQDAWHLIVSLVSH